MVKQEINVTDVDIFTHPASKTTRQDYRIGEFSCSVYMIRTF